MSSSRGETVANGQRCWLPWLGGNEGAESDWDSLEATENAPWAVYTANLGANEFPP